MIVMFFNFLETTASVTLGGNTTKANKKSDKNAKTQTGKCAREKDVLKPVTNGKKVKWFYSAVISCVLHQLIHQRKES